MNTQRYRWILYLISATIAITIAVQVYWNYKNYQLNKQRVTNEIQLSLDNSLEEYYADLAKSDFLTIFETHETLPSDSSFYVGRTEVQIRTSGDEHSAEWVDSVLVNVQNEYRNSFLKTGHEHDTIKGITQFSKSGDGFTLTRPNNLSAVKVLKGKKAQDSIALFKSIKPILIAIERDSLDYSKFDSLLQKQLGNKNISLSYTINHTKNDSLYHISNHSLKMDKLFIVDSKSTFLKPQEKIQLLYENPYSEALKRSSFGILISFLLAAAIVSCLFYLLRIIKNQKQLAEVKNDLISNITHEFKTPIATIGVALESIKNFKVLDDKKKTESYLDMSNEQLSKLNVMVEKLLETATLDSDNLDLNKEEVNLVELLDTIVKKHQLQTDSKFIAFQHSEAQVMANVDLFHFENAINNLLDNAIKYGGENISVGIDQDNQHTNITVSDSGTTLTKANKERIFEKFYRIPKGNTHDVKGFGIGLYYAQKIIEKHGGNISLDLKNALTTFKISLPND